VSFYARALAAVLLALFSSPAQAAISSVLSGASYQPVVAPDSWAVVFGTALAHSTATAALDANGQWPTVLAGTTVEVNGQAAELYYVSPGQINFLVSDGTAFGSLTVVITDFSSGASQSSSVTVRNTAAGIFSSDASGAGPGAILNGVTYAPAPFLVETPQNGGSDLRTRLAVYCSGVRWAGNPAHDPTVTNVAAFVTAQGQDPAGNQYTFAVEYAGAAPGFFGLDQVNIVLPPQLDGAGAVSLTIAAEGTASNVVTFVVNSLPASSIRLVSLALSSSDITGGNSVSGTVSLNGLAKGGGFPVSLRSSIPTLPVPSLVTVAQGQVSATFTFSAPATATMQTATITALANSSTQTATLEIDPASLAQLGAFSVAPPAVQGGTSLTGTLGLTAPAALGGVNVQVSSDNAAVQPPATVTIPSNSSSTTFTIPTTTVTAPQTANLTATLGNTTLTARATVVPALQLSLAESSITGGSSVTATVTLGKAASGSGANLTVTSSASSIAQAPGTVNIPSGQTSATFTITTFTVTAARTVTITVNYEAAGLSQSAMLTVNPQAVGQLQSLTVAPAQVTGGASATGTIMLTGPAQVGGLIVQLKTSNILTAQVPLLVTVTQGQTSATFTITTAKVASPQTVTITATAGADTESAALTVN
jgi:uncharacterized protein (TIGR03437 family)